jgi:hypothetical protein
MYGGLSDKGAHFPEWFEIVKNFLKLDIAGDRHEVKRPCNRCRNIRMLFEYEISGHITKHRLWRRRAPISTALHSALIFIGDVAPLMNIWGRSKSNCPAHIFVDEAHILVGLGTDEYNLNYIHPYQ